MPVFRSQCVSVFIFLDLSRRLTGLIPKNSGKNEEKMHGHNGTNRSNACRCRCCRPLRLEAVGLQNTNHFLSMSQLWVSHTFAVLRWFWCYQTQTAFSLVCGHRSDIRWASFGGLGVESRFSGFPGESSLDRLASIKSVNIDVSLNVHAWHIDATRQTMQDHAQGALTCLYTRGNT